MAAEQFKIDLCAQPSDVRIEFDTERTGVSFWKGEWHGPNRDRLTLHFRLAENWFEAVYSQGLAVYRKKLVLSAEKTRPPGGMDEAWRLLVADQTKEKNFCRPVIGYAVKFMDKLVMDYPLRFAAHRLRLPYLKALGLGGTDG